MPRLASRPIVPMLWNLNCGIGRPLLLNPSLFPPLPHNPSSLILVMSLPRASRSFVLFALIASVHHQTMCLVFQEGLHILATPQGPFSAPSCRRHPLCGSLGLWSPGLAWTGTPGHKQVRTKFAIINPAHRRGACGRSRCWESRFRGISVGHSGCRFFFFFVVRSLSFLALSFTCCPSLSLLAPAPDRSTLLCHRVPGCWFPGPFEVLSFPTWGLMTDSKHFFKISSTPWVLSGA